MGSAGAPLQVNTAPAVALLVGGILVLAVLAGAVARRAPPPEVHAAKTAAQLGPHGRQALDRCRYNVTIIHDVHWAAACESHARDVKLKWLQCLQTKKACDADAEPPDDMPDCTLPPSRAFNLNNARAVAEHQCLDEAAFVERLASARQ